METTTQAAPTQSNAPLARYATYASVSVAVVLITAKSAAWFLTDSIAILSSLIDSLVDLAASLVTFFAVRQALTPADREHRFGHGKAEPLAALAQSAFIIGSAVLLIFEAVSRFLHPREVAQTDVGIGVMIFAIVLTTALVLFQRWVIRRTGSIAINADALHYRADLVMNTGVIVALLLTGWLGWKYADPIFGVAIAIYIAGNAWTIIRDALDMLMDREVPEEIRNRIYEIAQSHPDARMAHDLKTRRSGSTMFIQLHLEMDPQISLLQAHRIADEVESMLHEAFPNSEIIIHQDPEGLDEHHVSYG